jgi:indole-3-glycerol phosphate synthase
VNRSASLSSVLDRIVATKRAEVAALLPRRAELRVRAADAPVPPSFEGALRAGPHVAVIAEVKRRSPSAGEIRGGASAVEVAASYEGAGAAAISVLTDGEYFGGSLADLEACRAAVTAPLLRKDFVLDAVQVHEARAAGASAVLLIVRILSDGELRDLSGVAADAGLDVLVEVHDEAELERAAAADARIIGVNNRDLATFRTDLEVTERLAPQVPAGALLVAESGLRNAADVARVAAAGAGAVLVGETLMRAPDPAAVLRALASVPRVAAAAGAPTHGATAGSRP